ncbi:hypothetical protein SAMN04489841_2517 [Natrinema salaciae]|uniref:Halobacterial output domain-containing protein n=2 Tax=Natrinema salaciae TaxID=1186196 RepID=A0A1H9JEG1_9EURY|nr:hypothetical protein SAMN04489841_2517 [Natrinema salaciae]
MGGGSMTDRNSSTAYDLLCDISDRERCDIVDLPPLYRTLDPDALDSLTESDGVRIDFSYLGYDVTVDSDEIRIEPSQPH